jgi:tight adherence protein B
MTRRNLALAPLALVALLALSGPASAATGAVHIRQIDTSGFPTVAVTVSAEGTVSPSSLLVTENGRPVSGLRSETLLQSGTSFDVVLAIDASNSVSGAPLQAAVAAARNFVQGLPAEVSVGVETFSDTVRVLQPVTSDHAAAIQSIDSISGTRQGTALYDSVTAASKMFSGKTQRNVVLLTDGHDVGSTATLGEAVSAAKRAHVGVFTVGLGSQADASVLSTMAKRTGAGYLAAVESNLSSIYGQLARELSSQVVLTYRSSLPAGAEVTVGVQSGAATDQSIVLLPPAATTAAPSGGGFHWALHGDLALAVVLGALFMGVFGVALLIFGEAERTRRRRDLARRMGAPTRGQFIAPEEREARPGGPASWLPEPVVSAAERLAEAGGLSASLEQRLERAGAPMTPGEFLILSAGAAVLGAILGWVIRGPVPALVLAALGAMTPYFVLRRKETKRVNLLHEQLPEVLMILASSLRAGHSFLQALETASKDVGDPSGPEFARVVAEIRLGRPSHEAMTALAERVGTEEFKWAVLGINVQREVGGNLAEILDTLAETVRERDAIQRQIKVLSGEARLSMKIMIALPPLMVLYIVAVNPDYMRLLWTTKVGWFMIVGACLFMSIGVFVVRKLVRINV